MMDPGDLILFERSLQNAVARHSGRSLDAALDELGWREALDHDTQTAVATLFSLQGSAHASSSSLDHVLAHGLGLKAPRSPGVVLPALGHGTPPGECVGPDLVVRGLGTAALESHAETIIVTRNGGAAVAAVVPTAALTVRRIAGMDPDLGLLEVAGTVPSGGTRDELPASAWPAALALGQLAVGHELVGAARKMLELARQHALERAQFGQVIGKFQAVRHRLAETLVAIEAADAMLSAAWEDGGSPTAAAVAKALAGRAARTAARHCQQVLAGIGFTTEHEFHHYVRRTLALNEIFGGSRTLTAALGLELLTSQQLPPLVPL